ncbi:hypothetical protein ATCC90586_001833 [Pythium insidiosum]|nr:hypothetical protein ATCC90586_001833 [Pythium insidiosum]
MNTDAFIAYVDFMFPFAAWAPIPEAVIRRGFKSCFMGADDELALWRHEVYGYSFMAALIDRSAPDAPDDMDISDDERDDDELDDAVLIDGVATIDIE